MHDPNNFNKMASINSQRNIHLTWFSSANVEMESCWDHFMYNYTKIINQLFFSISVNIGRIFTPISKTTVLIIIITVNCSSPSWLGQKKKFYIDNQTWLNSFYHTLHFHLQTTYNKWLHSNYLGKETIRWHRQALRVFNTQCNLPSFIKSQV